MNKQTETKALSRLLRLGNLTDADENLGNFIPCGIIDHTGLRQVKDSLKDAHGIGGPLTVDAVGGNGRDCRVISGDPVQLLLHLTDFRTGGADGQIVSGPGRRNLGNLVRGIDVHIIAIIVPDNLYRRVSFVGQIFGAPLFQPRTGDALSVTVRREDRLSDTGAGEIVGKNIIYQYIDILKDIAAVDPFLIVGCGGCNGEIIALVSIPRNR